MPLANLRLPNWLFRLKNILYTGKKSLFEPYYFKTILFETHLASRVWEMHAYVNLDTYNIIKVEVAATSLHDQYIPGPLFVFLTICSCTTYNQPLTTYTGLHSYTKYEINIAGTLLLLFVICATLSNFSSETKQTYSELIISSSRIQPPMNVSIWYKALHCIHHLLNLNLVYT